MRKIQLRVPKDEAEHLQGLFTLNGIHTAVEDGDAGTSVVSLLLPDLADSTAGLKMAAA